VFLALKQSLISSGWTKDSTQKTYIRNTGTGAISKKYRWSHKPYRLNLLRRPGKGKGTTGLSFHK